ncbi:MAG: hypothetical protein A3J74_08090 [Elusimicrobia bacterium RIFCSPHIGHO2_02_FULL_57_9]|nr:MAG: hypothetical protein A3J74_08090 [Elusimicrobia bacterium RIFCSPHIGHO2_02_FULL_57_9]
MDDMLAGERIDLRGPDPGFDLFELVLPIVFFLEALMGSGGAHGDNLRALSVEKGGRWMRGKRQPQYS